MDCAGGGSLGERVVTVPFLCQGRVGKRKQTAPVSFLSSFFLLFFQATAGCWLLAAWLLGNGKSAKTNSMIKRNCRKHEGEKNIENTFLGLSINFVHKMRKQKRECIYSLSSAKSNGAHPFVTK